MISGNPISPRSARPIAGMAVALLLIFLGGSAQAAVGPGAVSAGTCACAGMGVFMWPFSMSPFSPSRPDAPVAPPSPGAQGGDATSNVAAPATVAPAPAVTPVPAPALPSAGQIASPAPAAEPTTLAPAAAAPAPAALTAPTRPRLEVALGMGLSLDGAGPGDGRTVAVPAFEIQVGAGDGMTGFEARLFSSQASGRYQMVADRLAVDALVAFRPWAPRFFGDARWIRRCLRSVTVNLGLGAESASVGQQSVLRKGLLVGAHLDFPITASTDPSELRVRLGIRRMFAGRGQIGNTVVTDSGLEAFAGLAVVF